MGVFDSVYIFNRQIYFKLYDHVSDNGIEDDGSNNDMKKEFWWQFSPPPTDINELMHRVLASRVLVN